MVVTILVADANQKIASFWIAGDPLVWVYWNVPIGGVRVEGYEGAGFVGIIIKSRRTSSSIIYSPPPLVDPECKQSDNK